MELQEYINYLNNQIEIAKSKIEKCNDVNYEYSDSLKKLEIRINTEQIETFSKVIKECEQLKQNIK